ncbi:MAG: DUF2828 family protein [Clostridia bacterium]|nr:DUF2828 family protein [Clostridia bacterium]MBQ7137918.1 DUF2828 family protein [Clostridia bacterium]
MLNHLKNEANMTITENGAATYASTLSDCLDLFATIGAIRQESDEEIITRFSRAFAENADIAMKILFFGRDVRGGLGERRVFRVIVNWLAGHEPAALRRNIALIPEYGRFDDLIALMGTVCEKDALAVIREQLRKDLASQEGVSLLAKWLPSVNASNAETVRMGKKIARALGMTDAEYRRTLVKLRARIRIIENNLREKDYTFDYAAQPSKAMFKYRAAFIRNDGERYGVFMEQVEKGEKTLHTGTLAPYEIIAPCVDGRCVFFHLSAEERKTMDVTWNALENFTTGENAIVVVDGSGSMYNGDKPMPAAVAMSLGIYFAERNTGAFKGHFITFSENPRLVEIKGRDIAEKVRYCMGYNEVANTNIQRVFELILNAALKNCVPQAEMPARIYIVSDMEFDWCAQDAGLTNFECAKHLFAEHGYKLPDVVFWNVASRHANQPVTMNEQGVALVSGCTPRIFSMVAGGNLSPWTVMMEVLGSERYARISA